MEFHVHGAACGCDRMDTTLDTITWWPLPFDIRITRGQCPNGIFMSIMSLFYLWTCGRWAAIRLFCDLRQSNGHVQHIKGVSSAKWNQLKLILCIAINKLLGYPRSWMCLCVENTGDMSFTLSLDNVQWQFDAIARTQPHYSVCVFISLTRLEEYIYENLWISVTRRCYVCTAACRPALDAVTTDIRQAIEIHNDQLAQWFY